MDVFTILKPEKALPLVFDSPHSGHRYPEDFDYACDFSVLEQAEDKHVDDLFSHAPQAGATLLLANFPRSYIDPNRAACDVDQTLLNEQWDGEHNPTSRSDAGIGLIRRLVKPGIPVYKRFLTASEIQNRIEKYHAPYHQALSDLIEEHHYNFGEVWHINCHSMPAGSAYPRQPIGLMGRKAKPVDFCLGDRDGTTCDRDFVHGIRDFLKSLGYTVSINDPFKGVELVSRYSDPTRGRHSLQLEINKALYMNEDTGEKSGGYSNLKDDIGKMVSFCADYITARQVPLAAD